MNISKLLGEFLGSQTEKVVKPGLKVEGKNYDDMQNTLDVFGDTITIRGDSDLPENINELLQDPMRIVMDSSKRSNISAFLGRLNDEVTADPQKAQAFFKNINEMGGGGSGYGKVFKKLNVEDVVRNATPQDLEDSLMAAFRYKETGKIDNKHLILNMANAVNLFNDFNHILQQQVKATDPRIKANLTKNMVARFMMLREIGAMVNHKASEAGQTLATMRHTKKVFELDYDTTLRNMMDLDLNISNLDQVQMNTLSRMFMNFKASEMVRVIEQMDTNWWQNLARGAGKGIKFTYDAVMELYYNALLSGGPTHLINTIGVGLHMLKDQVDSYVAAGVGAIRHKTMSAFGKDVSKYDRYTFDMANGRAMAQLNSTKDALRLFFKMMATGEGPDSVTKFDFKRKPVIQAPGSEGSDNLLDVFDQLAQGKHVSAGLNLLGISARISSRFMNSEDAFFKLIAKRGYLYEEAYKQQGQVFRHNIQKGMNPKEAEAVMNANISNMMNNPTTNFSREVLSRADEHARKMTFQQELGPFERSLATVFKIPGLNLLAPFVKTPINVGKTTLDNSFNIFPIVDALSRGQGKEFDKAVAKMITGQTIVWGTVMLASGMLGDGIKVVGGPHPDRKVRTFLREQGIQNYSIGFKQEDGSYKYVPFTRLDPISGLLAMATDYVQMSEYMEAEELDKLAQIMTLSVASYVGEQPFMQGIADFNNIVLSGQNANGWAKFFGQKAAQIKGTTESILNPFGIPLGNYIAKYGQNSQLPQPLGGYLRNMAPASAWERRMAILDDPTIKDTTYDYSVIARQDMHPFFQHYYDEINRIRANNSELNDSFEMQKGMFYKDRGSKEHIFGGYEHLFSPWNITTSKRDDVEEELYQLAMRSDGYNKDLAPRWNVREIDGIPLNKTQKDRFNYYWTTLDDKGFVEGESGYKQEYNLKNTLRNAIQSSEYKVQDDTGKSLMLNTIFNERRRMAKDKMVGNPVEFPELYELHQIVAREKESKIMLQKLKDKYLLQGE